MRIALFLFGLLWTSALAAQSDPITTAKKASALLNDAALALSEASRASDRVEALTQTVRAYEVGLSAMREALRRASIRERSLAMSFERKRERVSRLLGVVQSIGESPAPLLLMHPSGALGTARSGLILSEVTPALQAEAQTLKLQLQEIKDLRQFQSEAADQLRAALANVQQARAELVKSVGDRTDLPPRFADPEQLDKLALDSETLGSFAAGLAALSPEEGSNPADFETARGNLSLPVPGLIVLGSNEANALGEIRPGLTLATRSQALVTAPWPATIQYAGTLLDLGNVVILEPGRGFLIILAGLDQVFAKPGEVVDQGTALGLMGGLSPNPDAFLNSLTQGGGDTQQETLYIEIRQDNTPVDPQDWFAIEKE